LIASSDNPAKTSQPQVVSLRAAEMAYSEAQRYADRLGRNVDEFRTRAIATFTVGALVTTLFAQLVGPNLGFAGWAAVIFFLGVAGLGLKTLWPFKAVFGLKADDILKLTKPSRSDAGVTADAASSLVKQLGDTENSLEALAILLQIQIGVLALEILFWTIALAGK
jgi:hypothetical protein